MGTGFFSHPDFQLHEAGAGHPECPARLRAIETQLRGSGLWQELEHPTFAPATTSQLELCHLPQHVERVQRLALSGGGHLDGDTYVGPRSFEVAALASGAVVTAVGMVLQGELDNAFCAVRPPGHHAESGARPASPWGFCLFNHVAVGARFAQVEHGITKVAILDFDVHHGNGTQEIFDADPDVLFVSLHEWGIFPQSGSQYETGRGAGQGSTVNFPLPAGSGGMVYRRVWEAVGARLRDFEPQLILLSAGFDAHADDPLAHMELSSLDLGFLVLEAKAWADTLCGGKLVCVMEGGYNLQALAECVDLSLRALLGTSEEAVKDALVPSA